MEMMTIFVSCNPFDPLLQQQPFSPQFIQKTPNVSNTLLILVYLWPLLLFSRILLFPFCLSICDHRPLVPSSSSRETKILFVFDTDDESLDCFLQSQRRQFWQERFVLEAVTLLFKLYLETRQTITTVLFKQFIRHIILDDTCLSLVFSLCFVVSFLEMKSKTHYEHPWNRLLQQRWSRWEKTSKDTDHFLFSHLL